MQYSMSVDADTLPVGLLTCIQVPIQEEYIHITKQDTLLKCGTICYLKMDQLRTIRFLPEGRKVSSSNNGPPSKKLRQVTTAL